MLFVATTSSAAGDKVILRSLENPGAEIRIHGEVLDYTGRAVRVRAAGGLEQSYPASRVVEVQSTWTPPHLAGSAAATEDDHRKAVREFLSAMRQESRVWVRRMILADLVWSYRALGEMEQAGDMFLLLYQSDPGTQYLDAIPLAWWPGEMVGHTKAEAWLADESSPAARLLGASHLLSSDRRDDAQATLGQLHRETDKRLAALAEAQSWRATFRPRAEMIDRWEQRIEAMPEAARAGAFFVVGQAWLGVDQHERAALALLRVPIVFPRGRQLSAAALASAGKALADADQSEAAARLFREAIDGYAASRWRDEAERQLTNLINDNK